VSIYFLLYKIKKCLHSFVTMTKIQLQGVPFTQIANVVLDDERLTYKAKGLFAYLYSKPPGWKFSAERVAKKSKDGRKSVLSGFKELSFLGYLTTIKKQDGTVDYYVSYIPQKSEKALLPKSPQSPNGTVPKRHSAKKALISNNILLSNNININNKEYIGEFKNVSLTVEEQTKLITKLGKLASDNLIQDLSLYLESNSKAKNKYSSHYATLLQWYIRKQQDKPKIDNSVYTSKQVDSNNIYN
jgi:hypothetical protein